jgi:hypothetical protein
MGRLVLSWPTTYAELWIATGARTRGYFSLAWPTTAYWLNYNGPLSYKLPAYQVAAYLSLLSILA